MLNITDRTVKHARGFSLIEALLALLILSVGLLGLASMQVSGLRSIRNSTDYTMAALALDDLAERIRGNPAALDLGVFTAYDLANEDCAAPPVPYCSAGGVLLCTPREMADSELYNWFCGASLRDSLPNALASITCDDSDTTDIDPCTPGSSHIITLTWTALNQRRDSDASDTTDTWTLSMRVLP